VLVLDDVVVGTVVVVGGSVVVVVDGGTSRQWETVSTLVLSIQCIPAGHGSSSAPLPVH
jgi:hypothetical protein